MPPADPSFQFRGAGRAVFGGGSAPQEGGSDNSAHDPQFEPIVPLPELVDVKTGEEDKQQGQSLRLRFKVFYD